MSIEQFKTRRTIIVETIELLIAILNIRRLLKKLNLAIHSHS